MAGRKHSPQDRARLETMARAMRLTGHDMQSIAETVQVSVTTLHKWAREKRWRLEDIAQQCPNSPDASQEPDAVSVAGLGPDFRQDDDCVSSDAPLTAAEAAAQALAMASAALVAGNMPRAERAARLALRFRALAPTGEMVVAPPSGADADEDNPSGEPSDDDPRMELFRRLEKLGEAHWRNHPDPPDWARREYDLPPRDVDNSPPSSQT